MFRFATKIRISVWAMVLVVLCGATAVNGTHVPTYVTTDVETMNGFVVDALVTCSVAYGTYVSGGNEGCVTGLTTSECGFNFTCPIGVSVADAVATADHYWAHQYVTPIVFDMGTATQDVFVFNATDHGPFPEEAVEWTVWGSNSSDVSNFPTGWTLGTLCAIFKQGWVESGDCPGDDADDFTGLFTFSGSFRYVATYANYSITIFTDKAHTSWTAAGDNDTAPGWQSTEAELDAVGRPLGAKPTANAGSDVTVLVGDNVTLDGTASSGNILRYSWDTNGDLVVDETGGTVNVVYNTAGLYTVTLFVVGECGCATDTKIVEVIENQPPVAACQDIVVAADGNCEACVSIDDGSSDPDGDAITFSQNPSCPYPLGQTLVTLTVTDSHGASSQCQATVTVEDLAPPTAQCPADITVDVDPGQCDAAVSWVATAADNCPGVSIACVPSSGSVFPIGTTAVTCTATDGVGNTAACSFTVTVLEGVGNIAGTLSAGCSVLGITVDVFNAAGELVGFAVTDDAGDYAITDLPSGQTYTVSFVAPLGYTASPSDKQVDVACNETVRCDFSLDCPVNAGAQRTIGFWKHQVGVATGGKGHAQIDAATLCGYLDMIASHFNTNAVNEVVIYVPPGTGVCDDKLAVAKSLLNLKGNVGMTARAKQQLMAVLLNVASGKLAQTAIISADGATVSQAITYADNLIDDPVGDHETAKTICDEINNNRQVASGVIPLATPDIAYRVIPEGFTLHQNFPNPFNAGTVISYELEDDGPTRLEIFDVLGVNIITLVDGDQAVGLHQVAWNGTDRNGQTVGSGMYFYRLTAGNVAMTKKMVLLK